MNGQVFIGISIAADQLGGNIFRDFTLTNAVGIPAGFIVMFATDR